MCPGVSILNRFVSSPWVKFFFFSTPVLPHCVCQKECPVLVSQPRFEKDNVLVRFISLTCCLCCHQSRDWFLFFLKKEHPVVTGSVHDSPHE